MVSIKWYVRVYFMRPLILIAITIITVGCKDSDSSYRTEPITDTRGDTRSGYFHYHKDTNTLFTGKQIRYKYEKKYSETNYKDGIRHGLNIEWHENGQKKSETNYKNDSIIKGSIKYWDRRGLPTDRLGRPINNP